MLKGRGRHSYPPFTAVNDVFRGQGNLAERLFFIGLRQLDPSENSKGLYPAQAPILSLLHFCIAHWKEQSCNFGSACHGTSSLDPVKNFRSPLVKPTFLEQCSLPCAFSNLFGNQTELGMHFTLLSMCGFHPVMQLVGPVASPGWARF